MTQTQFQSLHQRFENHCRGQIPDGMTAASYMMALMDDLQDFANNFDRNQPFPLAIHIRMAAHMDHASDTVSSENYIQFLESLYDTGLPSAHGSHLLTENLLYTFADLKKSPAVGRLLEMSASKGLENDDMGARKVLADKVMSYLNSVDCPIKGTPSDKALRTRIAQIVPGMA